MNLRKEFEEETGQKIEVTRTFETKVYETEVQIDVWNDDYIFWLQEKLVKLLAAPSVSDRRELLIAYGEWIHKLAGESNTELATRLADSYLESN